MLIDYRSFPYHGQHVYFYSSSYTSRFCLTTPTNKIMILVPPGFDFSELHFQLACTMIHFHMQATNPGRTLFLLLNMFCEYSMLKGPANFDFMNYSDCKYTLLRQDIHAVNNVDLVIVTYNFPTSHFNLEGNLPVKISLICPLPSHFH